MDEPVTKGYYNPHASTGHQCGLKGCSRKGINRVWFDNHTVVYVCDDHREEMSNAPILDVTSKEPEFVRQIKDATLRSLSIVPEGEGFPGSRIEVE